MDTDHAQAAALWARIEAHLVEHCGLPQDGRLDRERPALMRLLGLGRILPISENAPQGHEPPPENRGSSPPVQPAAIGTPVWLGSDGNIVPVHRGMGYRDPGIPAVPVMRGIGYTCRRCGTRIRGARHTDPRLVCPQCK